jgi:hypothetical protein
MMVGGEGRNLSAEDPGAEDCEPHFEQLATAATGGNAASAAAESVYRTA